MEIAVDLMVIPRSFSSCRVSVNLISPAFWVAMIPALETKESVRVDFPWSTVIEGDRVSDEGSRKIGENCRGAYHGR